MNILDSKEENTGIQMDWKDRKTRLYIEAGLAVLLTVILAASGAAGFFSAGEKADEARVAEAAAEEKTQADADPAADEKQENTAQGAQTADAGMDAQYLIMGSSDVTVQDMVDYFRGSGETYPAEELAEGGADSIETFCRIYYEEALAEGVKPEVAFAQSMKETGFLQYGGDASIGQFNFAGLGTTGNGVPGNSFPDVRTGIRAQIQHLKAYATEDALSRECVDERYEYVKKGSAPYVEWLGQQENPQGTGWATDANYGYDIVDMIEDMS